MLVAVYGTLRKDQGNHRLLETAKYLGTDKTEPKFSMYSLGYFPYIVEQGDTAVTVEVYDVDDHTFDRLDALEGYPGFYNRKQIDTTSYKDVWVYLFDEATSDDYQIDSGDWLTERFVY